MIHLRRALLVAVGGAIGSAARLAVGLFLPDAAGLPLAVLLVNVVGALFIGVLAARLPATGDLRVFLATGMLGGFTTYSAFAVGSIQLWVDAPLLAVVYALLSLGVGVLAAAVGLRLGRHRSGREAP